MEIATPRLNCEPVQFNNGLRRVEVIGQSFKHGNRQSPIAGLRGRDRLAEAVERLRGLLGCGPRPVDRLAIVGHQHLEADHVAGPFGAQVANGDEVAERLRHFLPFDLQETVVHPGLRHDGRMECAARLGDLVLMMRKHEIDAAAMDVEGLAEVLPGHGRAFDMPAGPTLDGDPGW